MMKNLNFEKLNAFKLFNILNEEIGIYCNNYDVKEDEKENDVFYVIIDPINFNSKKMINYFFECRHLPVKIEYKKDHVLYHYMGKNYNLYFSYNDTVSK